MDWVTSTRAAHGLAWHRWRRTSKRPRKAVGQASSCCAAALEGDLYTMCSPANRHGRNLVSIYRGYLHPLSYLIWSVCSSFSLSVSVSQSLSLCFSLSLSLSLYLSVSLSICLSVSLSLSVCLSVCLSVSLSHCVSVCLSVFLSPVSRYTITEIPEVGVQLLMWRVA